MECNTHGFRNWQSGFILGLAFGFLAVTGCEKPKPTVGEQVGNAIDQTINATGQAASDLQGNTKQAADDFKNQLNQASKEIDQQTRELRDAVKQAIDDHLSGGSSESNK